MYRFFKWIYLDIWIPANFYFSVLYGQVAQLKFLAEIMVIVGLGFFYLTGHKLTHKELLVTFAGIFVLGIGAGYGLIKLGVPQKGAKLGNSVNPQFLEILTRLEKIERKLDGQR